VGGKLFGAGQILFSLLQEEDGEEKRMWLLIALAAVLLVAAWIFVKRSPEEDVPPVRYVCDVCGEKDCICHKDEGEKAPE
jgi:hypothetical protein